MILHKLSLVKLEEYNDFIFKLLWTSPMHFRVTFDAKDE